MKQRKKSCSLSGERRQKRGVFPGSQFVQAPTLLSPVFCLYFFFIYIFVYFYFAHFPFETGNFPPPDREDGWGGVLRASDIERHIVV